MIKKIQYSGTSLFVINPFESLTKTDLYEN